MANLAEIRKAFPAVVLILAVLFSTIIGTQMVSLAEANPGFRLNDTRPPEINILSPDENQTCPSNNIWLNFTVGRPAFYRYSPYNQDYWSEGWIRFVEYGVDSFPYTNESTRIQVNEPINATNPPSNLTFSINLKTLKDGQHTVVVLAEGYTIGSVVDVYSGMRNFSVYTREVTQEPFPTTLVIALIASVAVIGVGLLVYFRKRNH
jgi:hypothetical protein